MSARPTPKPAPAPSAAAGEASSSTATAAPYGRALGRYVRAPVPISTPNASGPRCRPSRNTLSGTSRRASGRPNRAIRASLSSTATAAAATAAQRAGPGSGARTSDPSTTSTAAVIAPPVTSPRQNARAGVPRRTGELSTKAELRLQVEPLVAKPDAAPSSSQAPGTSHAGPAPVATAPAAPSAAAVSVPATETGCQRRGPAGAAVTAAIRRPGGRWSGT